MDQAEYTVTEQTPDEQKSIENTNASVFQKGSAISTIIAVWLALIISISGMLQINSIQAELEQIEINLQETGEYIMDLQQRVSKLESKIVQIERAGTGYENSVPKDSMPMLIPELLSTSDLLSDSPIDQ